MPKLERFEMKLLSTFLAQLALLLMAGGTIADVAPPSSPESAPAPVPEAVTAPEPALTIGFQHTFHSEILDEERELWVYLPNGYESSGTQRYPLIVVLDARGSFRPTAALIHTLSEGGAIPQMIVVGIKNTNRWRDLTPVEGMGIPGTGGGEEFLASLESEVIPLIESNWRTNGFRVFSGHSLGGLTALNALFRKPELFDAYIALSPSVEWDEGFMVERYRAYLDRAKNLDRMLYLAIADEAMERPYYDQLVDLIRQNTLQGLIWTSEIFEAEDDHMSMRVTGGLAGIRWVFRDWRLTSRRIYAMTNEDLDKHYEMASRRYKEPRALSMMEITDAGYWGLYDERTVDRAMEFFHLAIQKWPDRAYPYSCLGEGLERTGELEKALLQMEKALAMAKAEKHPDIPYFQGMADRVATALER